MINEKTVMIQAVINPMKDLLTAFLIMGAGILGSSWLNVMSSVSVARRQGTFSMLSYRAKVWDSRYCVLHNRCMVGATLDERYPD